LEKRCYARSSLAPYPTACTVRGGAGGKVPTAVTRRLPTLLRSRQSSPAPAGAQVAHQRSTPPPCATILAADSTSAASATPGGHLPQVWPSDAVALCLPAQKPLAACSHSPLTPISSHSRRQALARRATSAPTADKGVVLHACSKPSALTFGALVDAQCHGDDRFQFIPL
jgi:hypothetical protein